MVNLGRLLVVMVVLGGGVHSFAPASGAAAIYRGTVIDAETKAPLEGAVVVVIWYKKPLITMDGPEYFHKATEGLTDAEGKFVVDASPGMNWNPFRRVLKDPEIHPDITIYMPGYGPPETIPKQAMLGEGAVVELPRLQTREDRMRFADIPCCGIGSDSATLRHIPILLRLINIERKNLGLGGAIGPFLQGQVP